MGEVPGSDGSAQARASVAVVADVIDEALQRAFTASQAPVGLTEVQLRALKLLDPAKGTRMMALSKLLQLSAGATTTLVDRLVASGLAIRRSDDGDRRIVRAHLSLAGHAYLARLDRIRVETLVAACRAESAERRAELRLGLMEMLDACGAEFHGVLAD